MFPLRIYKIDGHSMEPTILAGSFVLVWRWQRHFKVGDIVAFHFDGKILIKRVAAINNNQIEVRGDNKQDSLDIGAIDLSKIIGKIIGK